MGRYENKKVVITGGSSGLGLATARLLVAAGARVLITGRDKDKLAAARRRTRRQRDPGPQRHGAGA